MCTEDDELGEGLSDLGARALQQVLAESAHVTPHPFILGGVYNTVHCTVYRPFPTPPKSRALYPFF